MKTPQRYLITLLFLLCALGQLQAKVHMVAEVGSLKCLEKQDSPLKKTQSIGIESEGANAVERQWLADIVGTIESMTNQDQAIRLFEGLKVVFSKTLRTNSSGGCLPAHQLIPGEIHIARFCPNGMKIPYAQGLLIHEMGHFIANKNGYYPRYNKAVKRKCKLTGYMSGNRAGKKHRNRNEEFAEVFASFLTYNKKLKRKCRKAHAFIKNELFLGTLPSCRN